MRVVSGTARGARLETLTGTDTRPTIERVKEGIFSSLQFILPGAKVLDLYAGSGQLGIEALSRGASSCVFIDFQRTAVQVVQNNLRAAGLFNKASVACMEAESFIRTAEKCFDIVLLDPPYNSGIIATMLPYIAQIVNDNAVVMCETELKAELPAECMGLVLKKQYKYGTILVSRYVKEANV